MKILDKYVAKNFLTGYAISFCVLMGLRIVIDLFVNLDEFTEHADLGAAAVIRNVLTYYALNSMLYFRDFAGMITVVAAAFSLGRMVRSNELVAVMASGVSLRRVIAPIIILALLLSVLLVVDQELLIPPLGDKLVRDQDGRRLIALADQQPDSNWRQFALDNAAAEAAVVSHGPLGQEMLDRLAARGVRLVVNGHMHVHENQIECLVFE